MGLLSGQALIVYEFYCLKKPLSKQFLSYENHSHREDWLVDVLSSLFYILLSSVTSTTRSL